LLERAAADMKRFYDQKRKPKDFQVGELVWLSMKDISTGRPKKKLNVKCEGPFKITEKISNVAYCLELPPTWKIHNSFHVSKLRKVRPNAFNQKLPKVTLHV
jgi:hypothetical protein